MITRKELLNHLKHNVYVRIKKSGVHGVGLFAIRDIPKGVDPFPSLHTYRYIDFDEKVLKVELPPEVYEMIDAYCAKEGTTLHIPEFGFNPIDYPYLINHSNTPNVATDEDGEHFITIRDIKSGEELFTDFSTYHDGEEQYIKTDK